MIVAYRVWYYDLTIKPVEFEGETPKFYIGKRGTRIKKETSYDAYFSTEEDAIAHIKEKINEKVEELQKTIERVEKDKAKLLELRRYWDHYYD